MTQPTPDRASSSTGLLGIGARRRPGLWQGLVRYALPAPGVGGKVIGYTGDTASTSSLIQVAAGADLLIAEAYYRDKPVPYHLRLADLQRHQAELASRRVILTHLSADMLAAEGQHSYQTACDGLTLRHLATPRAPR
jgi:ribonuclease BN (tRNA processing enzyme)